MWLPLVLVCAALLVAAPLAVVLSGDAEESGREADGVFTPGRDPGRDGGSDGEGPRMTTEASRTPDPPVPSDPGVGAADAGGSGADAGGGTGWTPASGARGGSGQGTTQPPAQQPARQQPPPPPPKDEPPKTCGCDRDRDGIDDLLDPVIDLDEAPIVGPVLP